MKQLRLVAFVVIVISLLVPASVTAETFPDLPKWASEEIIYLNEEEVVAGLPDGTFGSNDTITRGDAALMLSRAKKLPTPKRKNSTFPDVFDYVYYAEAIESSVEAGYLSGYPDGTFGPNDTLTREQMAKIIVEAYALTSKGENDFPDSTNSWARSEISSLHANGIAVGNDRGLFVPTESITRAEFSVMLARAMDDSFKVEPLKDMDVHFLDVGQGDATFIQTPSGKNILIDAGIQSAGQQVVNFLKEKDVGKLDMVIATHPHADHIAGLIPVLNAFKVEKFVDSGKTHTSQTYYNLLSLIDEKNIPFEIASVGNEYVFDNGFKMTVIHSDKNATNINDASVSVRAAYNNVSFMLTGDAEKAAENEMINRQFPLKSTVYKAGHHGSNTSSTQAFINKVNPEVTVLSYGKGNQYDHPHSDVVNRLFNSGSKVYSTAESGNITVTTNGLTYKINAKSMDKPSPPKPDPEPEPKPDPKPTPSKVNINTASYEELQNITGVGPTIAQRIVDYRNAGGTFKRVSDLTKIKGIGAVSVKKMIEATV
ncbi:MAG TPA: S-layer homology domain-containing protein [Bacillota bacterium]|nr:S-layer homology domain-containing protein [Bacillota bacterium]